MSRKVGAWILGARGNVGTCVIAGVAAIQRGLTDLTGLVSETRELRDLDLVPLSDLVFGGHEVRSGTLVEAARDFGARNGVLSKELIDTVQDDLVRADAAIRPGVVWGADDDVHAPTADATTAPASAAAAIERIQADLQAFRTDHGLDDVVVLNLISTEAHPGDVASLASLEAFQAALASGEDAEIPSSVLYAYAAVEAGFPFVDFTPAVAAGTAPVREMARRRGVPHMGRDGKTGETLVKTVLAPMFVARHLRVLSWQGVNMLGNRDGAVLRGAGALASKVRDKDEALRRILPDDDADSRVHIDYVPSLEDWKQAYDFIHFQGFLGARMQMHFLWQGCDSALAAPLAIDLVRLVDVARRRGETGTLPQLACFFKTPLDVEQQGFSEQLDLLHRWAVDVRADAVRAESVAQDDGHASAASRCPAVDERVSARVDSGT